MTDPENVFDIAGSYPVKLRVMGVLQASGTPDDRAVFVDLKTAWLIGGLAHGHSDVTTTNTDDTLVLNRDSSNVTANAALVEFTEVTPRTSRAFIFTAIPPTSLSRRLSLCNDEKSATLLRGRYQGPDATVQILAAPAVVEELLGLVFRIKRFFDANAALVGVATASVPAVGCGPVSAPASPEMETLFLLGSARGLIVKLAASEFAMIGG